MEVKKLHFFDKSGYELNFDWIATGTNSGYWKGNIYLPKVSVGLYSNTSIYVLEETTDENGDKQFVFPLVDDTESTITFEWDSENKFVDEFFMFTFDTTYIPKETSSLEYTPNDGPILTKNDILIQSRIDIYEANLKTEKVKAALPIHIAFTSPEKYNATTFKRTLIMKHGFLNQIARITFFAETVEEDERLKILCNNLGYKLNPQDELIFKKSNIKEAKPDYQLLNEKRKELLINGHEIYPYIGSYKALINAIKFFGYDNLNVIDIWMNINEYSDNYLKLYYVKKYTLTDSEIVYTNEHNINLPSSNYKKSPNIALSYYINQPKKDDDGNYLYDVFELPYTEEEFNYTLEEAVIKLFALKDKLNQEFLPGSSRIVDIIGEASYYGLCEVNSHFTFGSSRTYNVGKDLSFSAFPSTNIRITSDKLFNEYVYDKKIDGWNDKVKNLSTILENIEDLTFEDSDSDNDISFAIKNDIIENYFDSDDEGYPYTEAMLCNYYKDFYKALNVKYTIREDITDDLNDYYGKNYCYTSVYDNGDDTTTTKYENTISDKDNLIEITINSRLKSIPKKAFQNYKKLKKVTIKTGITEIGKYAFYNCTNLEYVLLPNTIKKIDLWAFAYCENLETFKFAGTETEWDSINKHNRWNYKSIKMGLPDCNSDYNTSVYDGYSLSAKVILTNNSLEEKTFSEVENSFGNISDYITFDNISYKEYIGIEWSVSFSEDQTDEELSNVGITKVYDSHDFSETKSGLLSEYNSCMFELPYVGYYDVKLSLTDNYNNVTSKIITKYIKVESYNIDIRGFYYDVREIPENLLKNYNKDCTDILFSDSDYEIDTEDYAQEYDDYISDEMYYIEMKSFIKNRIQSMIQIAVPESAPFKDENSMTVYRSIYDSLHTITYRKTSKIITKIDVIQYDDNGEIKYKDDGTYDTKTIYNNGYNISHTSSEVTYKKFYDSVDDSTYRIYTDVVFPDNYIYDEVGHSITEPENVKFLGDIENTPTYKYIEFKSDGTYTIDSTNENPILDSSNTLKQNTKFLGTELVNQGPYFLDNLFEEWYLADNVSFEMATLKPSMKYVRYIKNGVDIKPYTWFILGYEYSLIRGKCNPKWYLINNTLNKRYPNKRYADDDMSDDEIKSLPTHQGKYFTYLLKDEGDYTVVLELEDVNGNKYSIERNLFVVADDANYDLYTPFIDDYTVYTDTELEISNKVYNDAEYDEDEY